MIQGAKNFVLANLKSIWSCHTRAATIAACFNAPSPSAVSAVSAVKQQFQNCRGTEYVRTEEKKCGFLCPASAVMTPWAVVTRELLSWDIAVFMVVV